MRLLRGLRLTGLRGLRLAGLRLAAEGRARLARVPRLTGLGAVRLLLRAGVAVTTLRLAAVGLRRGRAGAGIREPLRAGTSGVATAAAAMTTVAMSARIRPMPAPRPLVKPPSPSKAPAGSKMLPSAHQAAKTVNAVPNWPRSSPATFFGCGRACDTTTSAAPMTPARTTPSTTGPLPHRLGMSASSEAPSIE